MKTITSIITILILSGLSLGFSGSVIITGMVTDVSGQPLPGVSVNYDHTTTGILTDINGYYSIRVSKEARVLVFSLKGFETVKKEIGQRTVINVTMKPDKLKDEMVIVEREVIPDKSDRILPGIPARDRKTSIAYQMTGGVATYDASGWYNNNFNTEGYSTIHENGYKSVLNNPLSTFSIDVDRASYSNIRRFINQGQRPPVDAVRIEELINYFNYDYPEPRNDHPFAVYTEIAECPWDDGHYLMHIGLKGKSIDRENLPPSNLVFLLDVSGSMNSPNKLPLLKSAFRLLVNELRAEDRVSIVVYAGAAGVVLEPTPGNKKQEILEAIDRLNAGGSTAGGEGLNLAYKLASENFMEEDNNRIILATDGDFNIGMSSNAEMERLIEKKRDEGVFITVLGFGMGNYKDDKMEIIADKGNGNYAYIDNIQEARKVLVSEFGGTMFTIAKDVKFQIEFNPAMIKSYRLIGYENRLLNDEDFNDDRKDAGEMGAGHTVTALYELVPAGSDQEGPSIDPLKYQEERRLVSQGISKELLTIKLRYKKPDGDKSIPIEIPVKKEILAFEKSSADLRFSAAVAGFGMLLRDSEHKGITTLDSVIEMAGNARGADEEGYRGEFIRLVKTVRDMRLITAPL
ncbi:MAG: von Willebrand factor type A domain-containing protein [Bacteroidales bacterium]|nr:von Willebrand factor type A domain-containing protein [Bacteroidales bacterium]